MNTTNIADEIETMHERSAVQAELSMQAKTFQVQLLSCMIAQNV
jgi:hypothetical protein